jgi:hypothetical protein
VKNQLYEFVEDMTIPEEMIKSIMESAVTNIGRVFSLHYGHALNIYSG